MSKASLKKELATFTREQLVDVVLNAYSASPEIKAYFEFFLNPDVDALIEKKVELIRKETDRSKRGYSKARISVLKKIIKEVEGYGAGDEAVLRLMTTAFAYLYVATHYYYCTETMVGGMCRLAADVFTKAHKMGCEKESLGKIVNIMSGISSPYAERVRSAVAAAANEAKVLISFRPQ